MGRRPRSCPRSVAWPHVRAQRANDRRVDHLRRPPDVPPRGVVLRLRLIACVRRHTRRPFWITVFPCPADGPLSWLAAGRPRAWAGIPGRWRFFFRRTSARPTDLRDSGERACPFACSPPVEGSKEKAKMGARTKASGELDLPIRLNAYEHRPGETGVGSSAVHT